MGIRSLCAATVVAVGVGSAAGAATIESGSYAVQMTLVESSWLCFMGDCEGPEPTSSVYKGLNVGDIVPAMLSLAFPNSSQVHFTLSWSDTTISDFLTLIRENVYWRSDNKWELSLYQTGDILSGVLVDGYYSAIWTQNARIEFTEVQPAPVPLPATAALLPLGIGALALMRRRRRQFN